MATVCHPDTGRITATFAGVAKHYGVKVKVCPPRSGHRKGVVERINHTAAQRWWRTLADELTAEQAQADCDRFVIAAVAPEAQHDGRGFRRGCTAAAMRIEKLEE
jgi:transposase